MRPQSDNVQGVANLLGARAGLTETETEILTYLLLGYPMKEIAESADYKITTVRSACESLRGKMGLERTIEVMPEAIDAAAALAVERSRRCDQPADRGQAIGW